MFITSTYSLLSTCLEKTEELTCPVSRVIITIDVTSCDFTFFTKKEKQKSKNVLLSGLVLNFNESHYFELYDISHIRQNC